MPPPNNITFNLPLEEFIEPYQLVILDLWGVMHDGVKPYPDAIKTLTSLRRRNKRVILLSNAPRRAFKVFDTMDRLGFDRKLYDDIVTSGELGYYWLENEGKKLGNEYYYIGPPKDEDILDGLDKTRVFDPREAKFALVTGFDNFGDEFETKKGETDKCLEAGIPLVCVNPDRIVVRQTGEKMLCAGLIAEYYQENGGEVYYFGKPYKNAYERCMELSGISDTSQIVAIGDSLHTDIEGANNMDIYSVLVTGGILADKFKTNYGELPPEQNLLELFAGEKTYPKAVIPTFSWL